MKFEERLEQLVQSAFEESTDTTDEIISAMELKIYALREEQEADADD